VHYDEKREASDHPERVPALLTFDSSIRHNHMQRIIPNPLRQFE
jgi:hypothetical protein